MNISSIECPNCGSPVDLDLDNPQEYCSRCGSKLMLDISSIQKLMIEREKTKQLEIREKTQAESEKEERKLQSKTNKIRLIACAVWTLLVAIAYIVSIIVNKPIMPIAIFDIWIIGLAVVFLGTGYVIKNNKDNEKK